ncbi:unnamed protein product [Diabrotica balteata]|uniref:Sorting nexin-3 n=1 Tax=Diabrotica balteata TaxID=107213 RepID=A0A9N9XG35_DIABA|nr:unnamed protein product [Diabrotica balteata]
MGFLNSHYRYHYILISLVDTGCWLSLRFVYECDKFELKTNLPVFKVKESSVRRRYSDFEWLRNELERDSKIVVPPLPGKAWKRQLPFRGDDGIFEEDFIEDRRKGLEVFINKPFHCKNGLRQGDGLSCLLFNLALEKVIRECHINTNDTIFNKSVQVVGYADNIDIIATSTEAMIEAFRSLRASALRIGLKVNAQKTKYMYCTRSGNQIPGLLIDDLELEGVNTFVYLGSLLTKDNNVSEEINNVVKCIKLARLQWIGHVIRRDEDATTRKIFDRRGRVGRRARGKPKLRYQENIEDDLKS